MTSLPFAIWQYRPPYLPEGRCILFADGLRPAEPEVFVLGWPQAQSSPATEPVEHPLGLREMRSVSLGLPDPVGISNSLGAMKDAGLVEVHRSERPELVIRFTAKKAVRRRVPELGLTLSGTSEY